jgi:signal transduction histidine kinase
MQSTDNISQSTATDQLRMLETVQNVALDILSSKTGLEALRHIVEAARYITKAKYGALGVGRIDNQKGLMEFVTSEISQEDEAKIGHRPIGVGLLGLLLERKDPLRIDNIAADKSSSGFPPNHPQMTTFLGVPIISGDQTLGSIYLTEKEDGAVFTEVDELALEELGAHAAVAIRNLHMIKRQRALVTGLISAQEEERKAVAYDLHDGLTQYVMASHAHFESYKSAKDSENTARADREFESGMRYLKEAVIESRRLVNGLRTLALDDLGLAGALEQLFSEEGRRCGWIETQFVHNIDNQRFDSVIETSIYRVAQEALTNILKHANANRVELTIQLTKTGTLGHSLNLEVRDWGCGFVHQDAVLDNRVGLHSMFERILNLNGTWSVDSSPGNGTIVRASILIIDDSFDQSIKGD